MCLLSSRRAAARCGILLAAAIPALVKGSTQDIRVVTYNTQGDVSSPTPTGVLPYVATVLEGIGQEKYTGDGIQQLPDIIALQETTSNSTSVAPLTTDLNNFYGNANLFAYSTYQATQSGSATTGNGPNALIYNQTTMNLMASVGVGTPEGSTNGEYRQVVRYEFQPLADKGTSNGIFYVYDCHAKSLSSGSQSSDQTAQQEEATIIRSDEATLPSTAAVLYMGDWNGNASTDPSFVEMTSAGQGQAFDALNPTNQPQNWQKSTGTYLTFLSDADDKLQYRDDIQFMTSNVLNDAAGSLDYVANSVHVFGNNGSIAEGGNVDNTASNTALADIVGYGSLTPSQVLSAMNNTVGSDHLPVVADYSIVLPTNGIWNGGTGNWSNPACWSGGLVPNSSTLEVKIANGNPTASVVTLDINATASDVILDSNNTLNINAGQTLTLAGPATTLFNGTVNASGSVLAVRVNVGTGGSFTLNSGGMIALSSSFTNQGTTLLNGSQNWSPGAVFNNSSGSASFGTDAGSNGSNLTINVLSGTVTFASTQHLAALNISSGTTATLIGGGGGGGKRRGKRASLDSHYANTHRCRDIGSGR